MDKELLAAAIQQRLEAIFAAFAAGRDVPPATLYRAEGYIEAACELAVVDEREVMVWMQALHQQYFNGPLVIAMAASAIRIPRLMQRAPVFPSTKQP